MLSLVLLVTLGGFHGASLLESADRFAQGPVVDSDRAALISRLELLEATRPPSVAPGTVLLSVAAASAGVGILSVLVGFVGSIFGGGAIFNTALVILLVGVGIGVVLGVIGGVLLGVALGQRKERSREIGELREQLRKDPLEVRPPPGAPPAAFGPRPALLLAEF